jgi:hypothetical protein
VLLLDVTPLSLGIMIAGGLFSVLIQQQHDGAHVEEPHLHHGPRQPDLGEDPGAAG